VIEGGMSTEDKAREERFLHIEIDSKDIDTLEEPKVLTNFKYISKDGEKVIDASSDIEFFDKDGELKQNLLIKGNNLLALHTLKSNLAGKVKLIYIDPPYNTGNDGFKYNDNFNHSTWLVFMKNRLEIARELLRDDGVIFVQCDDNEQAYLKVLMDEVFGRENFLTNFLWRRTKTPPRLSKNVARVHDFILCYGVSNNLQLNKIPLKEEYVKKTYKNPDNDPRGDWRLVPLLQPDNSTNKIATYTLPDGRKITGKWRCSEESFEGYIKNNLLYYSEGGNPNRKLFLSEVDGQISDTWIGDLITNEQATKENFDIFDMNNFSAPKPEELIKFLVTLSTKENDIVLDYHLGSGTTAAVAHKMGRRWIGIEQMDYIEDIAKVRLQKVIDGEQGGISKAVSWQGGGDFVYLELKKYNQEYVDRIQAAKSLSELEAAYVDIRSNAFLKFWFDKADFERDENFRLASLEERKQKLIDILDENQLYLNYPDMEDSRHRVTEAEKTLSRKF
jgi:adenine-specific DNA-methyltransferase